MSDKYSNLGMDITHPTNRHNFSCVWMPFGAFYFSYRTIIAVLKNGVCYVRNEKYSNTTSKHQKYVREYHSNIVEMENSEFLEKLSEVLNKE